MDIFEILKEAKDPDSTKDEKQDTKTDDVKDDTSTNEKESDRPEDTEDVSSDDEDTETVPEEDENPEEDTSDEDTSDDVNVEIDEVEADDSGSDDEGFVPDPEGGDESPTDDSNTDKPVDSAEATKSLALLNSLIELYFNIKQNITKLDKIDQTDIITNRIVIQVKKNLTTLTEYLYEHITKKYQIDTYIKNLYTYNYFIESYKMNVEMLKKISVFTTNT